ncbi:MAG: hypothetical protein IKP62_00655 [Salinivirgaceae bacterium]|nr:hypothetical protein [Salinivirgaceae bacterium]
MDPELIIDMAALGIMALLPIGLCILFMWIDQKWQAWLRRRDDEWDTEKHCVK